MKVSEYLKSVEKSTDNEQFRKAMTESVDIWSNNACNGYCIMAMQAAGVDRETTEKVLEELYWLYDEKTIAEAEAAHKEF